MQCKIGRVNRPLSAFLLAKRLNQFFVSVVLEHGERLFPLLLEQERNQGCRTEQRICQRIFQRICQRNQKMKLIFGVKV